MFFVKEQNKVILNFESDRKIFLDVAIILGAVARCLKNEEMEAICLKFRDVGMSDQEVEVPYDEFIKFRDYYLDIINNYTSLFFVAMDALNFHLERRQIPPITFEDEELYTTWIEHTLVCR